MASGRQVSAGTVGRVLHFSAKRKHLKRLKGLLPESRGQHLTLTALYALYSLESGLAEGSCSSPLLLSSLELSDTKDYEPLPRRHRADSLFFFVSLEP